MKREPQAKEIWLSGISSRSWTPIHESRSTAMPATLSHRADRSTNSLATSAPHRKNATQRNTDAGHGKEEKVQAENPVQRLIKQAVDSLVQQLEAGKSESLTAYLSTMARFHQYSFLRYA